MPVIRHTEHRLDGLHRKADTAQVWCTCGWGYETSAPNSSYAALTAWRAHRTTEEAWRNYRLADGEGEALPPGDAA